MHPFPLKLLIVQARIGLGSILTARRAPHTISFALQLLYQQPPSVVFQCPAGEEHLKAVCLNDPPSMGVLSPSASIKGETKKAVVMTCPPYLGMLQMPKLMIV